MLPLVFGIKQKKYFRDAQRVRKHTKIATCPMPWVEENKSLKKKLVACSQGCTS
jgi:hypothetical protein